MIARGEDPPSSVKIDDEDECEAALMLFDIDLSYDGPVDVQEVLSGHSKPLEMSFFFGLARYREERQKNPEVYERFSEELDWFYERDGLEFLTDLYQLVAKFKQNDIVWGVGRGSCCASFVLYCMEVHDVNPIKWGIPFSEMTKEVEGKW